MLDKEVSGDAHLCLKISAACYCRTGIFTNKAENLFCYIICLKCWFHSVLRITTPRSNRLKYLGPHAAGLIYHTSSNRIPAIRSSCKEAFHCSLSIRAQTRQYLIGIYACRCGQRLRAICHFLCCLALDCLGLQC